MATYFPNNPEKHCILKQEFIGDIIIDMKFIEDFRFKLPELSQQVIADEITFGAVNREYVTKAGTTNRGKTLNSTHAFAIITVLLLRVPSFYRGSHSERNTQFEFTRKMRTDVLELLYDYGVSCAAGTCCNLVSDPLTKSKRR